MLVACVAPFMWAQLYMAKFKTSDFNLFSSRFIFFYHLFLSFSDFLHHKTYNTNGISPPPPHDTQLSLTRRRWRRAPPPVTGRTGRTRRAARCTLRITHVSPASVGRALLIRMDRAAARLTVDLASGGDVKFCLSFLLCNSTCSAVRAFQWWERVGQHRQVFMCCHLVI